MYILQFEGTEIALDSRVGIFITMNPGYAGRTELPESVKALFRPVVVIVPDLQQICEIMLFSEGFLLAKVSKLIVMGQLLVFQIKVLVKRNIKFYAPIFQILAKKMTVLYKLAKEQLSKQYHYDFGLRALKSVLVMAGELKRGSPDLAEVISFGVSSRICEICFSLLRNYYSKYYQNNPVFFFSLGHRTYESTARHEHAEICL